MIAALVLASLCAVPHSRAGEVWKVEGTISDEVETSVDSDGATTTETVSREFKLSYDNELLPDLSLKVEFDYTEDDEIVERDFNTNDTEASISAELKGKWWTTSAEFTESVSTTDDPSEFAEIDDSYSFDAKLEPEHDLLPDLSFTIEGDNDTLDRSYEGAFEYSFLDLVEIKLEASKETSSPADPLEDNTDDRTFSSELTFDNTFGDAWKLELSWAHDRDQSLTLDPDGYLVEKDDSLENELSGKIEFKTIEWLTTSLERTLDWTKEFGAEGSSEFTDNWKGEISAEPELTSFLSLKLSYSDERESTEGGDSDEETWDQEYSAEVEYSPFDIVKVSGTYDGSDTRTQPEDPADTGTKDHSDEYEVSVEAKVWDDQISATATRSFTYEWQSGSRSSRQRTWEFESEFKLETVPNLSFTPSYTTSRDDDFIEATADTESEINVEIQYELTVGDVTTASLDHTYTRSSYYPPDEVHYLERKDETTLTLELADFLQGMKMSSEISRTASDKSEDDVGPEVDYNFSWEYEWTSLDIYKLSLKYEYDMPDESEDSKLYEVTFTCPFFLDHFEVNFEYSHDVQVEGETNATYSYLIEVKGEF